MNGKADVGDRIDALDGLRGVAVIAVIGFHYFSYWTVPLNAVNFYPYGASFANFPPFRFGYLGVHLFFLVSGFVISLTLTRCDTAREFLVRRFARLFPAMLLASSVTFTVIRLLPPHFWALQTCDFIPSLTFVAPWIYRRLLGIDCAYIDGAYWSLFVEVRFYAFAALIYFVGEKSRFLRNSALVMNLAIVVLLLETVASRTPGIGIAGVLLFPAFAPWLFSGVAFYFLWKDPTNRTAWVVTIEGLVANVAYSIAVVGGAEWIAIIGIYLLFACFVFRVTELSFLAAPWLTRVGAASYVLYLLHQYIGVTAISALASSLGLVGWISVTAALVVASSLVIVAVVIHDNYEVPARRYVTRIGNRRLWPFTH